MPSARATQQQVRRLAQEFEHLAFKMMNRRQQGVLPAGQEVSDRKFRAWFGISSFVCATAWFLLINTDGFQAPRQAKQEHFLWALMLLKQYSTEEILARDAGGIDEKTFRKWSWFFIEELSYMESEVILWKNRKINDVGNDCMVSVDGTDFRTQGKKSSAADKRLYSYKFKGAAYRYEVAIALLNPFIVWVAGPYLPGKDGWNDYAIFKDGLMEMLEPGERIEADDGYMGGCPRYCKCPGAVTNPTSRKKITRRIRGRHEAYNKRFKHFACLSDRFRHGMTKHSLCFRAVVVLTQLSIENGEEMVFDALEYIDGLDDERVEEIFGF